MHGCGNQIAVTNDVLDQGRGGVNDLGKTLKLGADIYFNTILMKNFPAALCCNGGDQITIFTSRGVLKTLRGTRGNGRGDVNLDVGSLSTGVCGVGKVVVGGC